MPLTAHDFLWLIPAALGFVNAYQNKTINEAILSLKLELLDRIARAEGDIKELRAIMTIWHAPRDLTQQYNERQPAKQK